MNFVVVTHCLHLLRAQLLSSLMLYRVMSSVIGMFIV